MNAIVFITGSKSSYPFAIAAKNKGFKIIVFDLEHNAYCKNISDYFYAISANDKNKILLEVNKLRITLNVLGVLCYSSSLNALTTTSFLTSMLNLKGCSEESLKITYNKNMLHEVMIDNNINTPKRYDSNISCSNISYPCIAKCADGIGSLGTEIISTENKLQSYLKNSKVDFSSLVFEEYIDGELVHIDGFVQNGKPNLFHAAKKEIQIINNIPLTSGYIPFQEILTNKKYSELMLQIKKCASEIQIDNHFFGADIILDTQADNFYILEVGYLLDAKMDRLLYHEGIDVYGILVDIVTGVDVRIKEVFSVKSEKILEFIYSNRDGNLKIKSHGQHLIEWEKNNGDSVKVPESVSDILGWHIYDNKFCHNAKLNNFYEVN